MARMVCMARHWGATGAPDGSLRQRPAGVRLFSTLAR